MSRCHRICTDFLVTFFVFGSLLVCVQPGTAAELPEGVMPPDAVLRPAPLAGAEDSTIAAMVDEVNGDSIFAFIEKLSGEVPVQFDYGEYSIVSRYTPCQISRMAAEFLEMCFEAYGYSIETHYYAVSKLHTILVQPAGVSLMGGQYGHIFITLNTSEWPRSKSGIEMLDETLYGCDYVSGDTFVAVGTAGTVVRSNDGGLTWTATVTGVSSRLEDVTILAGGTGWAAGASGVILFTTDGGASWSAQTSGVTEAFRDIAALDELTAVAVGDAGRIVRTVNGGLTWNTVTSGTSNALAGVYFIGPVGWAVGASGTILKTTDSGLNWSAMTSGTSANLKDVAFLDTNTGWAVGTDSEIIVTGNGGTSWTSQTPPLTGVTWRAIDVVSSSEAWIVGFDFYSGRAAVTTDGGANWESRESTVKGGTANVVAVKEGTTTPEEEMILGGHYDSVPSNCDDAPGADDNGSGIGVIVEAARVMAQTDFERTVKFVCFSGEEQGLHGSDAYAARAQAEGTQIVGMFNLDSVGWNDDYFRLFSDDYSAWLGDLALTMAGTYAPTLETYHWWCPTCNGSDHYPFWQHGFEAICGIETWDPTPPHHHTAGDTAGLLDRTLMANVAKISVATVASVAGVDTTGSAGIHKPAQTGFTHRLSKVQPNPFNPTTSIVFSVAAPGRITVKIFDPSGRLVRTLIDKTMPAGSHSVEWNGTDESGRRMSPGVYFYRIQVGPFAENSKLVLTR